jgi:murein DD-endopeptidase MepM/ murein hydrolase activator NlpD
MVTPIDGARMSSGYGMRRHPIQGYNRMHRGLDFAAPTGTPIMAAGDGIVEHAGRKGSYGHYIRIRHPNEYHTAYAHLSRYASGIKSGVRVKQGQTIGYVGSTGVSTGPHLHYEVLHRGKHVNPSTVRTPPGRILEGDALARFHLAKTGLEALYASLEKQARMAEVSREKDKDRL